MDYDSNVKGSIYNIDKHIDSWDALRFVFILGIMIFHLGARFDYYGSNILGFIYSTSGYFGNYFFFILSGLLMALTYKEQISDGQEPFGRYLFRRLRKIYPVYILAEVLAIGNRVATSGWTAVSVRHIAADTLLVTSGWVFDQVPYDIAAWFLCVLLLCYILYFFIVRISHGNQILYIVLIGFMALLGAVLIEEDLDFPFLYRINGEGYMNFFLGCLVYEGYRYIEKTERKIWTCIAGGGLILLVVAGCLKEDFFLHYKIFISLFCILLLLLAERAGIVRRVLECRPLTFLGGISMELFLLHVPVLNIYCDIITRLNTGSLNPGIHYLLYFVCVITICIIVSAIENKIQNRRVNHADS